MELITEWITQELTYEYKNEIEKRMHENTMVYDGFTVVPNTRLPFFMQMNPLRVSYEKRIQKEI